MPNTISLSEILHSRPAVEPAIYGYILPGLKSHEGCIKIGYTDRNVETRVREQLHAAAISFKILFKESAMRAAAQNGTLTKLSALMCTPPRLKQEEVAKR